MESVKQTIKDSYPTPSEYYEKLNAEFNFNDDPCPLLGGLFFDGLSREWGDSVFINPPYSDPGPWLARAVQEWQKGKTIVVLLRGDTSTKWFHKWVLPYAELRFVEGRLCFGTGQAAPFASIVAVYRGNNR